MAVAVLVLASLWVSGVLSGPLTYPDLTPRLSSEIRELINEVVDDGRRKVRANRLATYATCWALLPSSLHNFRDI